MTAGSEQQAVSSKNMETNPMKKIFFPALGALLLALTFPALAQQPGRVYRIGYLSVLPAAQEKTLLPAFQQGLQELGYLEGKNIVIEQRYAEGKRDRLPALSADLVRLKVDIIVTGGAGVPAAKGATSTIPIVMTYHANPVAAGLVASLAQPGGNVTGLSDFHGELVSKRLELLKEVVPAASQVAVLLRPANSTHLLQLKELQAAAPALGVTLLSLDVEGREDIDRAFSTLRKPRPGGLLVLGATEFRTHRRRIVDLAAKSRLPTIFTEGEWVDSGGLMSYGTSFPDLYWRAATYVDKILKGRKPADLPVEQPKKFEFVVNLKTAKQIGLTIPPNLLARADKVIK